MGDSELYRFDEPEDGYRLKDEPPVRRRYVPPPGHDDDISELPGRHARSGIDLFYVILGIAILLWVGLGLTAAVWPWMGLVLAGLGLLVCLGSRFYLTALIFREDPEAGMYAMFSKWYRLWYLHQNLELTLWPTIVAVIGLLMLLTGVALFLSRARLELI